MKLISVTIDNFRNYAGTNTVVLETSDSHNIVLVGGQNGAGKTSMVDAIRLCLYGNKFDGSPLSEAKYQKYLESVCNRKSPSRFSVSMQLCLDEENPPLFVTISRSFEKKESKYHESLSLKRGDSKVEIVNPEYWEYYVSNIIPPISSRYFFFDGEKVREIIASQDSKKFLEVALDEISGISQLTVLKSDLIEVRKKIMSKNKKTDSERLVQLRQDLDSILDEIKRIDDRQEERRVAFEKNKAELDELEQERSRVIGSTDEKRKQLSSRLSVLKASYDETQNIVSDFSYTSLPFVIAKKAIDRTVSQAVSENQSIINDYSVQNLQKMLDSNSIPAIDGISKATSRSVIESLIESMSKKIDESSNLLDLTLSRIEQLRSINISAEDLSSFNAAVENRDYYYQEILLFEKKLSKLMDESVSELDESIRDLTTELEVLRRQDEDDDTRRQELQSKQSTVESSINREERLMVLGDVDKASLENIALVLANVDNRIEINRSNGRLTLEKKINEIYHVLKNSKDMVKSVDVSVDFEIILKDFNDKPVDTAYISEGEKGILMYSVVYALHSLSKSSFPVIIDSPLGRMDSKHVSNLVEKYFPSIASQVILLSHDREITGESYAMIKPYVSRSYTIRKSNVPKIVEGYFE